MRPSGRTETGGSGRPGVEFGQERQRRVPIAEDRVGRGPVDGEGRVVPADPMTLARVELLGDLVQVVNLGVAIERITEASGHEQP